MADNGFNPLRWDCFAEGKGCMNRLLRPKIEVFAECFPGRMNFGDVDGWIEIRGYFGVLEWKSVGGSLGLGQKLAFERFTRNAGYVVFLVEGDAETMAVKRFCTFWRGRQLRWEDADLARLKTAMAIWGVGADMRRWRTVAVMRR